jgi:putative ABC transport system permease protein
MALDTFLQDTRFALRLLRRSPGFALAAVTTLALGIGANTAMFSVVNTVLLRPLPYPQPEGLVRIRGGSSAPDLADMGRHLRLFEGLGGYRAHSFDLPGEPLAERVEGAVAAGDTLPLLGVAAARGRLLQAGDDRAGGEKVVVVSDAFWRTRLLADPAAVGGNVRFVSGTYRVVGVMPQGFRLPQVDVADVIAPLRTESRAEAEARGAHSLAGFGRLRPDVTVEQAQAELDALRPVMAALDPVENADRRYVLLPLHAFLVRDVRASILLLFGAVGCVLLIAAVNVVNLLLARGALREREMAIRASVGASRARLLRQLLVEGLVIAGLGALAGLMVAAWMLEAVVALGRDQVPALATVGLDGQVLAFTAAVSVVVALLFGLAPGLVRAEAEAATLKEGARTTGGGRDRARRLLVAAEVALSVVLLAGAGLLLRSLHHIQSVDPGFDARGLVTFDLQLPMGRYAEVARRTAFAEQLLPRLAAEPGVTAAAVTTELPFGTNVVPQNFLVDGAPPVEAGREPDVNSRSVSPGYLEAMGIPLKAGRTLAASDTAAALPVALVNQAAARTLFGGTDPVGRRVAWAREEPRRWITVVGVVGDVRGAALEAGDAPACYTPLAQEVRPWRTWMHVVLRTPLPAATVMAGVREQVARADKDLPLTRVRTMEQLMSGSWGDRRFSLVLLAAFALVALTLAGVGIHGVMAYAVLQRTREIGVRMALGAHARDVLRLVLGQGLQLTLAGLGLGLAAALALRRLLAGMLYGVEPSDPVTLAGVAVLLLAVALLACYFPTRRAVRVDPAVALRHQ